jgi:hypothetical protein
MEVPNEQKHLIAQVLANITETLLVTARIVETMASTPTTPKSPSAGGLSVVRARTA